MTSAWRRRHDSAGTLAGVVFATSIAVAACGAAGPSGGSPVRSSGASVAAASESARVEIIESSTQLHLDGVGVGVGNIREEEYTPSDGTPVRGLTAGVFISVEADTSQNQTLRAFPELEIEVPGYRLRVLTVEAASMQLEVIDLP